MSKEDKRTLLVCAIIVILVLALSFWGINSFILSPNKNSANNNGSSNNSSNTSEEDDYNYNKYDNDYFDKDNKIENDTDNENVEKETEEDSKQESNEKVNNKNNGNTTGYNKNTGYNKGGSSNNSSGSGGSTTPIITTVTSNVGGQMMSCNATNSNKCSITLPGYTPKEGYEFIGWSTNPNSHTGAMPGQSYGISNGETLYPITRKDSITYTAIFDGTGSGISSVGSNKLSCTIKEVYNDEEQDTSCDIILPNIKVNEGYSASGWSTNPSDTNVLEGGSKVSIDKDTTFYANALGNSYTIEYYNGDKKLGSSNALVGVDTGLTSSTMLGAEKLGYTFKGWDITSPSNNVVYSDSEVVNSLTLTDGDTIRLYAVYIDDVKPVCSFGTSNELTTGDTTTLKLTCTDTGSGMDSQNLTSTNFTISNGNGQVTGVSAPTKVENGYEWNISVKGVSVGVFNVSLNENSIKDKNNNPNESITSSNFTVVGKTFTATFTKGSNVTSIGATTLSCTTTGANTSCTVTAPTITATSGYEVVGWNTDNNATTGIAPNNNITLTNNATYHTIVTAPANSNILVAYTYTYDKETNPTGCITGEEPTCVETTCYTNKNINSCPAGTIIKYKVNSSETKYFHVLHDDGATLTLQQRENIWGSSKWYTEKDNSKGPLTALPRLESKTAGWSNVNTINYSMGTTVFKTNAYTGCDDNGNCTANKYTLGARSAKARMVTVQEVAAVGCTKESRSCPSWVFNYLSNSTNNGGTVNSGTSVRYWTMSASDLLSSSVFELTSFGNFERYSTTDEFSALRAVVVINK